MKKEFDFLGKRKIAFFLSGGLIIIGVISLILKGGPNYGIDFSGGALIHLKFSEEIKVSDLSMLRSVLRDIKDLQIQRSAELGKEKTEIYIRFKAEKEEDLKHVKDLIIKRFRRFTDSSEEWVGPSIGKELKRLALLAILFALGGMILYISWRFKFNFAVAAVAALIHDVLIAVGILSLIDKELSIPIIASLLTIIGYSLNDTIVVFDRIRENLRLLGRKMNYLQILNTSINQTLNRTIITSLTTLFAVLALYIFGGGAIHDFSFVLLIGVFVGTYSSIFVATPILFAWKR
ncbi:MAG: protein translocase subunit SecF [bacterium]|nr:protein translocase subunit SecF [bacterium]